MMQEFMELLKQKMKEQGGPKKDSEMEAKARSAKSMSDILSEDLTEGIKDSKSKVTVASDSPEGLKKGLEKAEDMLESKMEDESEEMDSEDESEDKEDVEMKIAELEKELKDLKSKRS
jgi:hypothetical protein